VSLVPRMKPTGRTDCSPCCRADCGADDWCSCSCCGACLCCGACYVCCFVCGRATAAACGGDGGHVRARGQSAVGCVPPRLRPWTRLLRTKRGARGARRCHHQTISRRCLPRPCVCSQRDLPAPWLWRVPLPTSLFLASLAPSLVQLFLG
jgi:hypothetical protein